MLYRSTIDDDDIRRCGLGNGGGVGTGCTSLDDIGDVDSGGCAGGVVEHIELVDFL